MVGDIISGMWWCRQVDFECGLSAAAIPGNVDPHPEAGIDGAVKAFLKSRAIAQCPA
jgi:hypothetical protein